MASDIKVNNIKSYTGNTLTFGQSGDTVVLASGATSSGFGATGAVNWDTTPKTSNFNAVSGTGYFVDTTSDDVYATLPATPSAGDIVAFKDYAANFATNNLIIVRNGSNIQAVDEDALLTTNKASLVLVYVDATKGWLFTVESNVGDLTATPPDAPTIGTAIATNATTATVDFTAPANNGGSPITLYTATSSPDGITGTLAQAGSGTITVSGLTTDTAYTFTVTATNSLGTSDPSSASNSVTPVNPAFVVATGGTITTSGDFKIHTFTSSGTFTVSEVGNPTGSDTVSYMVVAGGGAGGGSLGGGGGAGGYREGKDVLDTYTASPLDSGSSLPVSVQGYPVTVGGGGAGEPGANGKPAAAPSGSNSVFSTITSAGGGGAGNFSNPSSSAINGGRDGGSGGGSTIGINPSFGGTGGTGNTPSVSPPQGFDGASRGSYGPFNGTGGGGATATGSGGTPNNPSPALKINGGDGATTSITGTPTAYAGGGGGGTHASSSSVGGSGGAGGGGAGGDAPSSTDDGTAGTANTGGGGGGGGHDASGNYGASGGGGSGVVIIRYKFQ